MKAQRVWHGKNSWDRDGLENMVIVGLRESRQILAQNLGLSIMGLSRGGHNLNFIIEKDSIGFGYEVKLAMKIIAMADQKCEVGKTTYTVRAS